MIEAHAARWGRSAIPAHVAACLMCVRLGCRETWDQKLALAGAFLTYALLVSVWASLWRLVPEATLARLSLGYAQMVWYFALTEVVAFSIGHAYRQIEHEIQTGGTVAFLVRPVGYVALTGALELGRMAARIALIGMPGCVLAWALTGMVPFRVHMFLPLTVLLLGAGSVYLVLQLMIGLATAWIGTARALFFIVQKCVFVLGALIVPLTAYPELLQRIAWLTPFPAALYAPASLALGTDAAHVGRMLGLQVFWLAAAAVVLAGMSAGFERRLTVQGEA